MTEQTVVEQPSFVPAIASDRINLMPPVTMPPVTMPPVTMPRPIINEEEEEEEVLTEEEAQRQAQVVSAVSALKDAAELVYNLGRSIAWIQNRLPPVANGKIVKRQPVAFAYLSKDSRNEALDRLVSQEADVQDAVRAAHRATKSIRRLKLSEEQMDFLVIHGHLENK